jgi:hypothetical protein
VPNHVEPHVPEVQLKDDSVILTVQVVGFTTGNWAEISGYIVQNGNAIPFSTIQKVSAPDPTGNASSLTVTLPPMPELTPGSDVTVITRVAEAQIWPTVLGYKSLPSPGFMATWLANPVGQQGSGSEVYPSTATAQTTGTEPPAGLIKGTKYLFTVEVVSEPEGTNT